MDLKTLRIIKLIVILFTLMAIFKLYNLDNKLSYQLTIIITIIFGTLDLYLPNF